MTDWADVAANRALSMCNLLAYSHDDHNIIAAALRQARLDALEEAAKVAEGPVKHRSLVTGEVIYRGNDEHDYAVDGSSDYGAGRIEAAAAIRSLKDKP